MPRTASGRAAVGAIAILTATIAGCASSTPPSPRQAIKLAALTTGKANSFAVKLNVNMTVDNPAGGKQTVTMAGTMAEQVRPALRARADFSAITVAGQTLPGGIREILTPGEIYMRFPTLSQSLHTSKPWIGISLSALSASSGLNFNSLFSQVKTSSPLTQARLLAGAKDVKAIGTGTVAGVPVTGYSGTYSMATALAKLPASLRASLRKSLKQAGIESGSVRFKAWVDGKHLIRKEKATITTSKLTETITLTISSINQPVTITPPPASQVYVLSPSQLGSAG